MGINIKTKNVVILTSYNWSMGSKYQKVPNLNYTRGKMVNILLRSDFYEEENIFNEKNIQEVNTDTSEDQLNLPKKTPMKAEAQDK